MNRFSSFVLKTSSHQGWWFDGLTWLSRLEVHRIKCERLCKSPSKWPIGKQTTSTVSSCRTERCAAPVKFFQLELRRVHRYHALLPDRHMAVGAPGGARPHRPLFNASRKRARCSVIFSNFRIVSEKPMV